MPITPDMLIELIESTITAREDTEAQIRKLAEKIQELEKGREELRTEEQGYRLALARRFPDTVAETAEAPTSTGLFSLDNGLEQQTRSDAVETAVRILSRGPEGFATPAAIEEFLEERGRDDSRDAIGATLAYLNRSSRVANVGRGKWKLAEDD